MLNNKEFDLWADGYDKAVGLSDEGNTYPFAGYKKVLGFIYQTIMGSENAVVLDIGFDRHIDNQAVRARLLHLWAGFFSKNDCAGIRENAKCTFISGGLFKRAC